MGDSAVSISQKGKYRLFVLLMALTIIEIILAFLLIIIFLQLHFRSRGKVHPPDKFQVRPIMFTILVTGLVTAYISAIGLKVLVDYKFPESRVNTKKALGTWLVIEIAVGLLSLYLAILSPSYGRYLSQSVRMSMMHGMDRYLSDLSWKRALDTIQTHFKCCGVENYEDWYQTSWMDIDSFKSNSSTSKEYIQPDGRILSRSVPWSCCSLDFEKPCFHDLLQQRAFGEKAHVMKESIYTRGCWEKVMASLLFFLRMASVISALIFVNQIFITICGFYLQTSNKHMELKGVLETYAHGEPNDQPFISTYQSSDAESSSGIPSRWQELTARISSCLHQNKNEDSSTTSRKMEFSNLENLPSEKEDEETLEERRKVHHESRNKNKRTRSKRSKKERKGPDDEETALKEPLLPSPSPDSSPTRSVNARVLNLTAEKVDDRIRGEPLLEVEDPSGRVSSSWHDIEAFQDTDSSSPERLTARGTSWREKGEGHEAMQRLLQQHEPTSRKKAREEVQNKRNRRLRKCRIMRAIGENYTSVDHKCLRLHR